MCFIKIECTILKKMSDTFKNKYRVSSARWQDWDYRTNAAYFITICTKNKAHYFGEINNGRIQLSNVGILADVFWHEIKNHADNVILDAFIVMPNHIHGIIVLDNKETDVTNPNVETRHALSLPPQTEINPQPTKTIGQNRFQNQGKNSISSIIGSYKAAVTKHANRLGYEFAWQTRFHDHIIRDAISYQRITDYINSNPLNWKNDKFYN